MRMLATGVVAAFLTVACFGSAEGGRHDAGYSELESACRDYCEFITKSGEGTDCSRPVEPCLEYCASDEWREDPCIGAAFAEFECRVSFGMKLVCEETPENQKFLIPKGGLEECEAERKEYQACECANYCDCDDEGVCGPPR